MALPVDVGHSIGVVRDPGVTQRVTEDGDSNDQATSQGVDHQGKSVLPPQRGLCDGRCCAVERTPAEKMHTLSYLLLCPIASNAFHRWD